MMAANFEPDIEKRLVRTAVRYVECPHCHVEVMARTDGRCLACSKSHFDTSGVDLHRTALTIEMAHQLPACCFMCGEETQSTRCYGWTYRIRPHGLPPWMIPLCVALSYVPGSQYSVTERLCLPVCRQCEGAARKIKPLSVRTGLEFRMPVHRVFRNRFEALNGKPVLEWDSELRTSDEAPRRTRGNQISMVGIDL